MLLRPGPAARFAVHQAVLGVLLSRLVRSACESLPAWPAALSAAGSNQRPTTRQVPPDDQCLCLFRPRAHRNWPIADWRGGPALPRPARAIAFRRPSWIALSLLPRKILAAYK